MKRKGFIPFDKDKIKQMKKFVFLGAMISLVLFIVQCAKEEEDTTPPVITLEGANPQYVNLNSDYVEPGYTAVDDADGDMTALVNITSDVDASVEGKYTRKYNVIDESGNPAEEVVREVVVIIF